MAGNVKGITVEIGGDTTKLGTALRARNSPGRYRKSLSRLIPLLNLIRVILSS